MKKIVIVLGVIIVVLLGILLYAPAPSQAPDDSIPGDTVRLEQEMDDNLDEALLELDALE